MDVSSIPADPTGGTSMYVCFFYDNSFYVGCVLPTGLLLMMIGTGRRPSVILAHRGQAGFSYATFPQRMYVHVYNTALWNYRLSWVTGMSRPDPAVHGGAQEACRK